VDCQAKRHYVNPKVKDKTKLRVLNSIPDKELKTRIVAIPDFWTQTILRPFRAHVQKVTQKLFAENDFSMSHDAGFDALRKAQTNQKIDPKRLFSYDFSNWTDRYHRDLQKAVVEGLFGGAVKESWTQLVVTCEWYYPKSGGRTVKYGQGQGMGTNGSFDVATLTDHLFIDFIYERNNVPKDLRLYGKVGDDLWIYDPELCFKDAYERINLPINLNKSKKFSPELNCSAGEFVSRVSLGGSDASRLSANLVNRTKDWRQIPTLLSMACRRGIKLRPTAFTNLGDDKSSKAGVLYRDLLSTVLGCLQHLDGVNVFNIPDSYLVENGWVSKNKIYDRSSFFRLRMAHALLSVASLYSRYLEVHHNILSDAWFALRYDDVMEIRKLSGDTFDRSSESYKYLLEKHTPYGPPNWWESKFPREFDVDRIILLQRFLIDFFLPNLLSKITWSEEEPDEDIVDVSAGPYTYAQVFKYICTRATQSYGQVTLPETASWVHATFEVVRTLRRYDKESNSIIVSSQADKTTLDSLLNSMSEKVVEFAPNIRIGDELPPKAGVTSYIDLIPQETDGEEE
jgi:hypothetical protein